ncbi:MAG: hypothetical protein UT94_C0024G0009 [Candidatus Uhrbacteria bacterium GW2011_GWF2_40_263]|nr:MAG: hypothetical protein UT94_C0024G0009 [Candidatus Uhrbacteria bacterium GW2011_GWF2_40_263]
MRKIISIKTDNGLIIYPSLGNSCSIGTNFIPCKESESKEILEKIDIKLLKEKLNE